MANQFIALTYRYIDCQLRKSVEDLVLSTIRHVPAGGRS